MTLYFEKLEDQIEQMGRELADRSESVAEQTQVAFQLLMSQNDLDAIWDQIMIARQNDAGFRGAAPMDEPINVAYPLPECPPTATLFAADGAQINPDPHGATPYWLTNVGVFVYYHGTDRLPDIVVEPSLHFSEADVRDPEGRLVATAAINAQRAVQEMQMLSQVTIRYAERDDCPRPLLALYDGPLLGMPMGKEVRNPAALQADYHESMDFLIDAGATLAGYVDRPTSRFVVYTLYLMTLDPEEITRPALQNVRMEGLSDAELFKALLGPGQRSALMIQQSPLNKEYKERWSPVQEICFFYLNAAGHGQDPYLARVEVPMWVAREKPLVDIVHSLIYAQCQITDRYPYVMTRADEIAAVHPGEKMALDEKISIEMLRQRQSLVTSQRLSTKWVARRGRQRHDRP